jgi:hypothetical protein
MKKLFILFSLLLYFLLPYKLLSQDNFTYPKNEDEKDNIVLRTPQEPDYAVLYSFSQLNTTFFSIVNAPGEVVLGTGVLDDQTYSNKPIGFTFNFDSTDYTAFGVSANGYIMMGGEVILTSYMVLNAIQNDVISAFNADLLSYVSTGRVSFLTSGTVPNRILTVQWTDFGFYPGGGGDTSHTNFQIKLYETTNIIQSVYGICNSGTTLHNVQVGIRGNSTADVSSRTTTTNWLTTTAGNSTSQCRFQVGVTPPLGLTFQWTPPVIVPYLCESFNSTTFPPTGWTVLFTGTNYWSRNTVSAFCLGTGSLKFDFFDAPIGTNQSVLSPLFPAISSGGGCDSLRFAHAHSGNSSSTDILQIQTSTNGGVNWVELTLLSTQLNTAPSQTTAFTPTCTQWGRKTFALPMGTNRLRLNAISAPDNNLYLDTICIICYTGIKPKIIGIPTEYSLSQNYPNPFNPKTIIIYQLPVSSFVKMTVYDILGRIVTELVSSEQKAGTYETEFNGSNLASGLYFYTITAGSFTETKKMTLIK